jgi:hypothetical protein
MTKLTAAELDHAIASQRQQFVADNAGPEPEGPLKALNPSGYVPSDHYIPRYRNGQPIAGEDVAEEPDPPRKPIDRWIIVGLALICVAWMALVIWAATP